MNPAAWYCSQPPLTTCHKLPALGEHSDGHGNQFWYHFTIIIVNEVLRCFSGPLVAPLNQPKIPFHTSFMHLYDFYCQLYF